MELSCTTELDAVNALLGAVGETPVNTLDDLGFTDASVARAILRSKSREVQSRGFYFNRDYDYTFTPDVDGIVTLPPNVISIRPSTIDTRRLVPRALKVWNGDDNTFVFPQDAGPTLEVVWMFDFEELPETARRYITVRAATQFQAQYQGNEQSYGFTQDDEKFAYMALLQEERDYEPRGNMFNDSQAVSEVFTR